MAYRHVAVVERVPPIAEVGEQLPEPDLPSLLRLGVDVEEAVRSRRELEELGRRDLGVSVPLPPGRQELPDLGALGVGVAVELLQVAEEAPHADRLEDAAEHAGPALEHAEDRAGGNGSARGEPRLTEDETGSDQLGPMLEDPAPQILMAESLAQPGSIALGVEPDADQTTARPAASRPSFSPVKTARSPLPFRCPFMAFSDL